MESYLREMEGKMSQGVSAQSGRVRRMLVSGPVIVGAGPSGLAVAACLRARGVPSLVLERADCIASLWQHKTYDRLCLHLPKHFCELPLMGFPPHFPTYPSKRQFVDYLLGYAERFNIRPAFGEAVERAEYDEALGMWRVRTPSTEYVCRWLVVATGENAEVVVPKIEGMQDFGGEMVHSSKYTSGEGYNGKRVLVVGCGNSGMEVCLDLCHHNALPSLVVRDAVHVLPKEMLGRSTFDLSMRLMRWLPLRIVDRVLLILTRVVLGDTTKLGLVRPNLGPLQLKHLSGKTPVLDVGTLAKIRTGHIQVMPAIRRLKHHSAEFVDGRTEHFDAILLATGYKSNVPCWLKENDMFSEEEGLPKKPFPNGWKGKHGLYAVGFTRRGLSGASTDAKKIAEDIERFWTRESKHLTAFASQT